MAKTKQDINKEDIKQQVDEKETVTTQLDETTTSVAEQKDATQEGAEVKIADTVETVDATQEDDEVKAADAVETVVTTQSVPDYLNPLHKDDIEIIPASATIVAEKHFSDKDIKTDAVVAQKLF